MDSKRVLQFLFALACMYMIFKGCCSQCTDMNEQCDFWANVSECLITPSYMMCLCRKSCKTPAFCASTSSNDSECKCRKWAFADQCNEPSVKANCPSTCAVRENVSCQGAPSVAHGHTVPIKATYYFLDTVTYECNEGYRRSGATPTLACNESGQWVFGRFGVLPKCKLIVCNSPPNVPDASWEGSSFEYNHTVVYSCNPGFESVGGSDVRRCDSARTWSGKDLVCQNIDCGSPPSMRNATATYTSTVYQNEATYSCDTGYNSSVTVVNKTCTEHGNWTGEDIVCSAVECGTPPNVARATLLYNSTTYRSTAEYTCIKGYNSSTVKAVLTCDANREWKGVSIQCEIIDCGIPPVVEHAQSIVNTTVFESITTYTCHTGYNVSAGSDVKTCAESGVWQGPDLICLIVNCGPAPEVSMTTRIGTGTTYGSTVTYSCIVGYKQTEGSRIKTCNDQGSWPGVDLVCIIVTCGTAPSLNGAHVTGNYSREYNSEVTYVCDIGYEESEGNATLTCAEDGTWKGHSLLCVEKPSPAEIIGIIKNFEPEVREASGSVGFGVAACVIMVVIITGILLLDVATCYKHIRYMRENLSHFWERRKPVTSICLPENKFSSDA